MVPLVVKSRNQLWLSKGKKKKHANFGGGYWVYYSNRVTMKPGIIRAAPNGTLVSLPNSTSPRKIPVMWLICRPIYREWGYWDGVSVFYRHAKSYQENIAAWKNAHWLSQFLWVKGLGMASLGLPLRVSPGWNQGVSQGSILFWRCCGESFLLPFLAFRSCLHF